MCSQVGDWNALFDTDHSQIHFEQDSIPVERVSVVATRCQYQGSGYLQVSSDDHRISVISQVPGLGGVPYHVTYPMMHGMLPTSLIPDAGENITFPQLLLRAVKIKSVSVREMARNSVFSEC